ncbi:quinone oxidoreductase family protein [Pseudonocardia nigra]|uniref:quinone oxidoreductase family protein n=1 Tax=Pseudonocardia nigra TaxID=1921578 RepID=UPI001C5D1862|nr:quinone oxidoreductase [Pseudonocardia nigra]
MAVVLHEQGGPEKLRWERVEVPPPGRGEARLRHTAVGLNYVDTYHRAGVAHPWPVPPRPCVLGLEAAGVVLDVGPHVDEVAVGDRVVYAGPPAGAYAEERVYPAANLVRLPDAVDDRTAAASFLRGITAQYLLHRTYPVRPGDWVLVHAAAGGMGLILGQWCRQLGARAIGTVSTDAKARVAREHGGFEHTVNYRDPDFPLQVRAITGGEGVHVVYESIGRDTFQRSLDCLRPLGVCAAYGHASGAPDPIDIVADLGARGSLFVTRPAVMHYTARREDLLAAAGAWFDVLAGGAVRVHVANTHPLREAARAHAALESGTTVGQTVLLVDHP